MESQLGLIEKSFNVKYSDGVREALDELSDSFTITDPSISGHPIVYVSRGFLKVFGYSKNEVLGKNGRVFQGPKTNRRSVMAIREAIREERGIQISLLNYRKDGTPFWMLFNMCPVYSEKDGRVVHFLGIQVPILRRRNSLGGGIGRNGGVCYDGGNCRGYVYKCCRRGPRMITKIEGRGNGIKTNIVNMVDVAKALARPASYTTKHFGCELGAQSKFDEKTGTSLVNGAHDTAKLAGLLEIFIKKYVQCYGCGNPETEILITKTQMIQLKCAACGFISDVDMRDKLTTFILKNPPESKKGAKDKKAMRRAEKERLKEGEAADEELKKLKKETKKKVSSKEATAKPTLKKKASGSDEDHASPPKKHVNVKEEEEEDDDDVQWQTDTSMEAAQQRIQEQLSAVTAEMVMLSTNETEKKPKAATTKAHQSTKVVSAPSDNDPKAENVERTFETLVEEVKVELKKGATASQFRSFLGSLSGSPQDVVNAVYEALLDGVEKAFAKELIKKKGYLLAAVGQEDGSQLFLLRALEEFCGKSNLAAVKEVALVLKALYDADVLEEESIVQWYQEGVIGVKKDSKIWKNVKPFIDWLQSAESESEED